MTELIISDFKSDKEMLDDEFWLIANQVNELERRLQDMRKKKI